MRVICTYSEAGGVSKTVSAVSLAMSSALMGKKTVLIDMDPRAASSSWLNIEPVGEGLHVGAILGSEESTEGYAEELAVQSTWHPNLRVIPSGRSVSNREMDRGSHGELRLKKSLKGLDAEVVIIDCANRQGGMLTLSALNAADTVLYAAIPTTEGLEGFIGAQESVHKFIESRQEIGAPINLKEGGIILSGIQTIPTRIARVTIAEMEETGLLLYPLIPHRVVVQESRASNDWYGNYLRGEPVAAAYRELTEGILK